MSALPQNRLMRFLGNKTMFASNVYHTLQDTEERTPLCQKRQCNLLYSHDFLGLVFRKLVAFINILFGHLVDLFLYLLLNILRYLT